MNSNKIFVVLLCVFALISSVSGQNAYDIIKKAEAHLKGESSLAEMKITTVRPTWQREMKMKSWTLGDDYSMIVITHPAKEKGTVFLKRIKEIWNWMPSIERTIKLPPSMMMQSWMGTDFNNDDLVRQNTLAEDYIQKIVGSEVIEGRDCWEISLKPKETVAVVWGEIRIWIDKKDYLQLRMVYSDEDGYEVNKMEMSDIRMMGGKLIPCRMEMIPLEEEGNKTIMEYISMTFNEKIDASFFSTQNMKRVR